MNISNLTAKIPPERYNLIFRGTLLVTAGSFIAIFETFIAIYFGLHQVSYRQAVYIAIFVLFMSSIFILASYFIKNLLVWHEWAFFMGYLIFFQIGFSLWTYRLGDMRFLAIINALTTITILLSYTNILQSLMISLMVLTNYFSVSWYSIKIAGQPGSFAKEAFFSFCLFPSFILISSAAYYITKKRHDLENAKFELEKLNSNLAEVNERLRKEQGMTEVEMDLASEIQGAIFPGKSPVTSDWDVAFLTRPYGSVSGDFYDFYSKDNSLKGVSLFDVSGHGVAPALITILAKPVLYSHFKRFESSRLGRVLESANADLFEQLEEVNLYITGLILRMEGPEVEYVNAGHPDLLHLQSSAKKIRVITDNLNSFKGHPIGINVSRTKYQSLKFSVSPGDCLIFYSDGLTESKNPDGEQFGLPRISYAAESSQGRDAAGVLKLIVDALDSFKGNIKSNDDITIIVARKL